MVDPPFMHVFLVFLILFFPLVTEKVQKTCVNTKTNDFDQQTACKAPARWSKYTTIRGKALYYRDGIRLRVKTNNHVLKLCLM